MTTWLIGLDGGGTKTDAVLCDETGQVYAQRRGDATSPTSASREMVHNRLKALLDALLISIGGRETPIAGCFGGFGGGGIAGNQPFLKSCLEELLPNAKALENGSDAVNALSSGIGVGDGIVAIAGTGSGVFTRIQGKMKQTGGWGYLLGDEGSGYDLGRRALAAALHAYDGLGDKTLLSALLEDRLGEPVQDAVARIYDKGMVYIASFAPVLLEAAERGDRVAMAQAEQAARCLSEAILVAGKPLHTAEKPVVLAGSVWQEGGLMEHSVRQQLGPSFRIVRPTLPPVYGSILEAAALAGFQLGESFNVRFRATFDKE